MEQEVPDLRPTRLAPVFAAISWLVLAISLPFITNTSGICCLCLPVIAGWVGFLLVWLWNEGFGPCRRADRISWFSILVAGMVGLFLGATDYGVILRLKLCEDDLKSYAERLCTEKSYDNTRRWVGLFHIDETDSFDGAVFMHTGGFLFDSTGIAYVPTEREDFDSYYLRHLYGHWYFFDFHN